MLAALQAFDPSGGLAPGGGDGRRSAPGELPDEELPEASRHQHGWSLSAEEVAELQQAWPGYEEFFEDGWLSDAEHETLWTYEDPFEFEEDPPPEGEQSTETVESDEPDELPEVPEIVVDTTPEPFREAPELPEKAPVEEEAEQASDPEMTEGREELEPGPPASESYFPGLGEPDDGYGVSDPCDTLLEDWYALVEAFEDAATFEEAEAAANTACEYLLNALNGWGCEELESVGGAYQPTTIEDDVTSEDLGSSWMNTLPSSTKPSVTVFTPYGTLATFYLDCEPVFVHVSH